MVLRYEMRHACTSDPRGTYSGVLQRIGSPLIEAQLQVERPGIVSNTRCIKPSM